MKKKFKAPKLRVTRMSRGDSLRTLANQYIAEHGDQPFDPDNLYEWAEERGLWQPIGMTRRLLFKAEMKKAMREEMYIDPQGRTVRKKVAVVLKRGERVYSLWGNLETFPPAHMKLAAQQRRRKSLADVHQQKTDVDSYNENNKWGAYIQMSWDFDKCLDEMNQPTEYPLAPPDENEG